ncbi:hypothetical protein K9M41_02810 [Candidatus Gracilibacteria bacterium]|nr:hypothetical protein [Candidatus Gracilibacteria bacterium]
MNTTIKTSVSIRRDLWHLLKEKSNKSGIINTALEIFFDRETFLNQAEKEYWKHVDNSLKSKTGEYKLLNPKGKKVTGDLLEKELWN